MKQLQITENNAMRLYNTASPEFKTALEDTFGKDFFHRDITDRIKTYEDACELLGLDSDDMPDVSCVPEEDEKSHIAYHKLIIIARALNEGWRPNWKNTNEDKWFNWWYIDTNTAGFGSAYSANAPSHTTAALGSRLCFKTKKLAVYAANQFQSLYEDYLLFN